MYFVFNVFLHLCHILLNSEMMFFYIILLVLIIELIHEVHSGILPLQPEQVSQKIRQVGTSFQKRQQMIHNKEMSYRNGKTKLTSIPLTCTNVYNHRVQFFPTSLLNKMFGIRTNSLLVSYQITNFL